MKIEQKLKNAGVNVDLHLMKTLGNLRNRYQHFGHNISLHQIADYICNNFDKKEPKSSLKNALYRLQNMKLTPVKKTAKLHRNMPCPCGSGKKYKKCCINKN